MWQYVFAAVVLYAGWSCVTLQINHKRASSMGIPLVRVPVDGLNVPWQVLGALMFKILDGLTSHTLPTFIHYTRRGWFWKDKAASHLRYGPVWATVTPKSTWVQLGDPDAVYELFSRKQDFIRPHENYKPLGLYGPNILTVNAQQWPRHRKLVASPFNESIMKFVWKESTRQATQMIASWADLGTSSIAEDTRTVSLNVLAATGFRKSFDFQSESSHRARTGTPAASTYRDALCKVLDNIILLLIFPTRILSLSFLPCSFKSIGEAAVDYRKHMELMLQEETAAVERGEQGSGSLMTSFVKALKAGEIAASDLQTSRGLSVDEVIGNVFIINFAGHDTTANTLAFALCLLASEPEIQRWLAEELDAVTKDDDSWDYERLYPSLMRCRAILYETLRMYPPVMALPKHTSSTPQRLQVGDREIVIPANVHVQPSLLALHMHPKYWVQPEKWNPQRWITRASGDSADQGEALVKPRRGTYFPWSEGPMNCPGRKFSEVEFTAVIACLMRTHRLSIVKELGESEQQSQQRTYKVVNDCDDQMLLKMRAPERVRLRCEQRI
ncbi:cytochrome P450 [Didymella exigua CBS 183.55]|uniref:Cytochrome P450 n=1 Tax=Didymella exigua CBS 183.55 TaxID=1150837 RepID=A0A6A5RBM6_9PLEO|nr:cytochrome P450 [Didymella exigua CBS 183.55]KAF1925641.1 cytochrome P450 [Didymella exigua CBS 183.55]